MIKAVFFDFGGVIAQEGWENGLADISAHHGYDRDKFFEDACDVLWSTGYMYGRADENEFWQGLRGRYDLSMTDEQMREAIFDRFVIRPEMIYLIKKIGQAGFRLAILSDQTNWLDELNRKHGFFELFEKVYNSYHLGKGKKDITVFGEVCSDFGESPSDVLFVDDNKGHVERAEKTGLQTVHFTDVQKNIDDIIKILKI